MTATDPAIPAQAVPARSEDPSTVSSRASNVVDFERPARTDRTTVKVDRRTDRITELTDDERRRLLVRIICELVALDDPAPTVQARAS